MMYVIVLLAVLARLIPHLPNFSPVYAALLFSGAYMKTRDFLWYPLALLGISDVALTVWVYHMHVGWTEPLELLAFASVALTGRWLRNRVSARNVLAAALAGPTAFFITSNFAVWLEWKMYPPTLQGLSACYVAALPFFRNTVASGLVYSVLLFGGYEIWKFASTRLHHSAIQHG